MGDVHTRSRPGLADASGADSDRFEELLVTANPAEHLPAVLDVMTCHDL